MMCTIEKFEFGNPSPVRPDVSADSSLRGKLALLRHLANRLSFPDYFGENWDALIDCLSDPTWSGEREVLIDHPNLPQLAADEMRCYLESLIDAMARRNVHGFPRLRVVFREADRSTIDRALRR
jgi:hypothetical protein